MNFKECRVRSKLFIHQKKLVEWKESDLPIAAYMGTIYLYNDEGSFITCYTYPTINTIYPECSNKYPGKIITNITFNIISKLHHPTFINYSDWVQKRNNNFKLDNGYDFDFEYRDNFLLFIKSAQNDGFKIYIRNDNCSNPSE
jgi:hypothetical protein